METRRGTTLKERLEKFLSHPLVIVATAFVIRLFYLYFFSLFDKPPVMDGRDYDTFASNLLRFREYSLSPGTASALRPPVYPLFLALIYCIFGHSYIAVRLLQAIISSLSCLLIAVLGEKMWNRGVGTLSAWLFAIHPGSIYLVGRFLSETLFVFLFILTLLLIIKNKTHWSGILLGVSILIRPNVVLFIPLLILFFWFIYGKKGGFLRRSLLILLEIFLLNLPWVIRNYLVFHEIVPFTNHGGWTFFACNNPLANGGYVSGPLDRMLGFEAHFNYAPSNLPLWKDSTEVRSDRTFLKKGLQWVWKNPKDFGLLIPKKLEKTWNPFRKPSQSFAKKFTIIFGIYYLFIMLLAIGGFLFTLTQWKRFFLIYSPILAVTINSVIFYGSTRMRFPSDPFLILLSSIGLDLILRIKRKKLLNGREFPKITLVI